MPALPSTSITELWSNLNWTNIAPREEPGLQFPFTKINIPAVPGLYRLTWHNTDEWPQTIKSIRVKATPLIVDPVLTFADSQPPVVLSIGRTTNLKNRLSQHFSKNKNSNRFLKRMRQILPDEMDDDAIRELSRQSINLEITSIDCWVQRCQLERYGTVVHHPIFDFDAEH